VTRQRPAARRIPVFEFGPALLQHHCEMSTFDELPPLDPREPAVQPAAPAQPLERAAARRYQVGPMAVAERVRREIEGQNELALLVAEFGIPLVQRWMMHLVRGERP
jgi:hypothetical protein